MVSRYFYKNDGILQQIIYKIIDIIRTEYNIRMVIIRMTPKFDRNDKVEQWLEILIYNLERSLEPMHMIEIFIFDMREISDKTKPTRTSPILIQNQRKYKWKILTALFTEKDKLKFTQRVSKITRRRHFLYYRTITQWVKVLNTQE